MPNQSDVEELALRSDKVRYNLKKGDLCEREA